MTNVEKFLSRHLEEDPSASEEFLAHYGVLGMKWGIRKDRNGRRRSTKAVKAEIERRRKKQARLDKKTARKEARKNRVESQFIAKERTNHPGIHKPFEEMTTQELNDFVNRLRLEQQLSQLLSPPQKADKAKATDFLGGIAADITKQATTAVGRKALEVALTKAINQALGKKGFRI